MSLKFEKILVKVLGINLEVVVVVRADGKYPSLLIVDLMTRWPKPT